MLASSTPEATNPVADVCERSGVPCISTFTPWQSHFFGRKGDPAKPFRWTYHFYWGLEDVIAVFTDMWGAVPTNKRVGALWPNDPDGYAWSNAERGFPPVLKRAGYEIVDPGRYQGDGDDYSSIIRRLREADVEILTGVPTPPDLATFWKQAGEQDFRPKVASMGRALLFPAFIEAIGADRRGAHHRRRLEPQPPLPLVPDRASGTDMAAAARLSDERRDIAMLCAEVRSVAEISAHLGIPVGVVRVLVGDEVADGHVHLYRPGTPDARPDLALLERVLEGLRSI